MVHISLTFFWLEDDCPLRQLAAFYVLKKILGGKEVNQLFHYV